jgi:hypothetical protein
LDLGLEFGDGAGGGGLIHHLVFLVLGFRRGSVFELVPLLLGQGGFARSVGQGDLGAALDRQLFPKPLLEPFPSAAQRLVDRLRRGGQSALQDRESKPHGASAPLTFQCVRTIELFAHVLGDAAVK